MALKTLAFLDILAELFHLVFQLGLLTRQYFVPAVVYAYVAAEYYVFPAFMIPVNYIKVRQARLALS